MTSADRRRAHLRVGAATVGVFLLFLLFGAAQRGANASSTVSPAPARNVQPDQSQASPNPYMPFDRRGGFDDRDGDGRGGFRGGPPDGGPPDGGPPDGGGFAAPGTGGGSTL